MEGNPIQPLPQSRVHRVLGFIVVITCAPFQPCKVSATLSPATFIRFLDPTRSTGLER